MKKSDFITGLDHYFTDYLPNIRQCSPKTIRAYSDSFIVFLDFMEKKHSKKSYQIGFSDLSAEVLDDYVIYLKKEKEYTPSSIRQRISALSSFLKYASKRDLKALKGLNSLSGIRMPKLVSGDFSYFSKEEISLILRIPSLLNKNGARNRAILSLLYDSGARSAEICALSLNDINLSKVPKVRLFGKGGKIREVPISPQVAKILKKYMDYENLDSARKHNSPLFTGERGNRITPETIKYLVKSTVRLAKEKHPNLFQCENYSPHSFRHSKAIHLLEGGIPLIYIRNFLGHSSVQTTEIYAKVTQANMNKTLSKYNSSIEYGEKDLKKKKTSNIPDFLRNI